MSKLKILTLDIETKPNKVWAWDNQLWTGHISPDNIIEPTGMITWAAKWLGQKQVFFRTQGDEDFVTKIWELINEADVVIHYYGKRFDVPHLNREFLEAGLTVPTPFFQIDMCALVKSTFNFPSNKLSYVSKKVLKDDAKMETGGFGLWMAFLRDEPWAKAKMKRYNIQDVIVTEKLYDKLKGWVQNHPNHGLYIDDQEAPVCRNCGSENIKQNGNEYDTTGVFAYQRYKCNDCGANLRGRDSVKGKKTVSMQVVK